MRDFFNRRPKLILIFSLLLVFALMLFLSQAPGHTDDIKDLKNWTKLVTISGVHTAYSGTSLETFSAYPPFILWIFKIFGHFYQIFFSPQFDQQTTLSTSFIKLPGIFFHLFIALAIYYFVSKRKNQKTALIASLFYAFNPAVIFDLAYWGMPDTIHSFFILLTIIFLVENKPFLAWPIYSLSFFSKPQAWIFAPFVFFLTWWKYDGKTVVKGLGLFLATFSIIISPFIYFRTIPQLINGLISEFGVLPNITNNANNLWGLVIEGRPILIPDSGILLAGFSYWGIGLLLFSIAYLIIIVRLKNENRQGNKVIILSAFLTFSYFILLTRIHKNHIFFILPLLSLLWYSSRKLFLIYFIISLTFFTNLVIFDPAFTSRFQGIERYFSQIQFANSCLNLTVFAYFFKEFLLKDLKTIISKSLAKINPLFLLPCSLFLVFFALIGLIYQIQLSLLGYQLIKGIIGSWETAKGLDYYFSVFDSMYSQITRIAFLFSMLGIFIVFGKYMKLRK